MTYPTSRRSSTIKAMRASVLPVISILFVLQVQANGVFDNVAPDGTPWVQIVSAVSVWLILMGVKFLFVDPALSTLSSDLPSESDVRK
jgi:L-asparagine transporter-like permease